VLTRGNFWFIVPVLMAGAFFCKWREAEPGRRLGAGILRMLMMLAAVIAVQLPYIIHNSSICGELTGPSTASDKVLALGNSPEAPPGGRQPGLPAGPMEYPDVWHQWMAQQDSEAVREKVFQWIKAEPLAFVELNCRKALLFWDNREIPNNIGFNVDPEYGIKGELDLAGLWGRAAFISSGILLVLGLCGIFAILPFFFRRRHLSIKIAGGIVVAYWLGVTAFYMLERFRAPVYPELALCGGIWSVAVWRKWRTAGRKGSLYI
jgi:hypothetical protein